MGRGIWIHASNHRLVRVIYRQPWMSIAAVTRDHPASLTGPGLRGREAAIDRRSREKRTTMMSRVLDLPSLE
jgi:hypothetical protein